MRFTPWIHVIHQNAAGRGRTETLDPARHQLAAVERYARLLSKHSPGFVEVWQDTSDRGRRKRFIIYRAGKKLL